MDVSYLDKETGKWLPLAPVPYPHRIIPGLWKRLTGWRDEHGRKAEIWWAFWEKDI